MSNLNSKKGGASSASQQVEHIKSRTFPPVIHNNITIEFPTPAGYSVKASPSTRSIKSIKSSKSNAFHVIPDIKSVSILRHPSKEFISAEEQRLFNIDSFREYKQKALEANTNRKIFMVHGNFRSVRNGLLRRGWVEKIPPGSFRALRQLSQHALLLRAKKGNDYEKVVLSKMVDHYPAYFIWQTKYNRDEYLNAFPYRNRVRRAKDFDFSTKQGFIGCAETTHWYTQADLSELKCPRFHSLTLDDQSRFLDDFRLTECFSLLSYIEDKGDDELNPLYSFEGAVPTLIIKFAIDRVADFVKNNIHTDVDEVVFEKTDEQWEHFITNSRLIIKKAEKFKCDKYDFEDYRAKIQKTLEDAKPYRPSLHMDGYNNLWIMKPGFSCRGRGIVIMRNYENIIQHANKYAKARYMVQKYIGESFFFFT